MEAKTVGEVNREEWERQHSGTLGYKPGTAERYVQRLEGLITDMKKCMAGDPSSKLWQELKIKLTNLQAERRVWFYPLHREEIKAMFPQKPPHDKESDYQRAVPDF